MGKMNANEYFESMGMNKVSAEHAGWALAMGAYPLLQCHERE